MADLVLFCGLGGATEGLVRAGWDVGACVDAWPEALEAHQRWRPELFTRELYVETAHEVLEGAYDRVWASPSCKPWSTANRTPKRGKAHPEYYSLAHLVRQAFGAWRARWLVIENVGGLIWSQEGRVEIAELEAEVARWPGLRLSRPRGGCIASNTLGVAQLRRRVFLVVGPAYVSLRPGGVDLPRAGTGAQLWEAGEASTAAILCDDHAAKWSAEYRGKRAAAGLVANERGRVNGAARLRATRSVARAENTHDRKRLRAERSVEAGEHLGQSKTPDGHREERTNTGRSLVECCALQQIPEWVVAGFTKRAAHEMVGNAVPPAVAEHIGRLVLEADHA